jgi:hypothetical protein
VLELLLLLLLLLSFCFRTLCGMMGFSYRVAAEILCCG